MALMHWGDCGLAKPGDDASRSTGTVCDSRASGVCLDKSTAPWAGGTPPGHLRLLFGHLGFQLLPEGVKRHRSVESLTGASLAGRGAAAGLGGNKGVCCGTPPPNKRANTPFGKRNKHKMFYTYYRHQQVPTVIHERDLGRKAIPLLRAAFLIRVSWSWLYCPNFKMRDLQAGRLSDLPNYRNIIWCGGGIWTNLVFLDPSTLPYPIYHVFYT